MAEEDAHLNRMASAEGSAAADGLAILLEHLLKKGSVDEAFVSEIRDMMLLGLDPSLAAADDRGLQLAYVNTLVRYRFLSTEPRELFEPEREGGIALKALMNERGGIRI